MSAQVPTWDDGGDVGLELFVALDPRPMSRSTGTTQHTGFRNLLFREMIATVVGKSAEVGCPRNGSPWQVSFAAPPSSRRFRLPPIVHGPEQLLQATAHAQQAVIEFVGECRTNDGMRQHTFRAIQTIVPIGP